MNHKKVIVALDYDEPSTALALVDRLRPEACRLKVGKELFVTAGPHFVEKLVARGFDVFLDLKFHDIPNTVAQACKAAAKLGVWMTNVHASGGRAMLTAAREAIDASSHKPLLIAVTVLTSMSDSDLVDIGLAGPASAAVSRLASLTHACGLDGVVCSGQEAAMLKSALGWKFKLVTPGIRPAGAEAGDQSRVLTPEKALGLGSDYLVIGRPITQAADPLAALSAINESISIFLAGQQ
ncbi:MAG TPA: orotidine-5'-phosphate decarboxylase [Burkholderiales bacterium]|nr:orotidine-5'-phosphate decarboxylase [Burkholderiales bacterium]